MLELPPRFRSWVSRLLSGIGLLVLLVSATPVTIWWAQRMAGDVYTQSGDVLIVLAGSTVNGQLLGESSYWRSVHAVRAWRAGGFQRLLLVGRAAPGTAAATPASVMMRGFLVAHGVPVERIEVETESQTTFENARMVAPLVAGGGRLVLLTSDYHMPRALAVFRKEGLVVEPMPAPDAGKRGSRWQGRWPAFLDLSTETAAWCWYRVNGRM
jgi:uncharacterized SAM-binding protein YcdF (DUF218 family)